MHELRPLLINVAHLTHFPIYAMIFVMKKEEPEEKKERQWKEFAGSPPRSGNGLYVSLGRFGVIVLNRRAYAALGEPETVTLNFDGESAIGLRPCVAFMPNAFPLVPRGRCGNRIVRALPFCKEHEIEPSGTIRFLNPEVEKDVLVLDLNQTVRTTQSPRKGWRKK